MQPKTNLCLSRYSALRNSPVSTRNTSHLAHAFKERAMKSEEDPANGSQDTAEKVHCFPSKVPVIIDPSKRKITSLIEHLRKARGTKFLVHLSNETMYGFTSNRV